MPDNPTYEQLESELKKTKSQLSERINEFKCLHDMSLLVERPGITLEELLQDLVNLIPPTWRHPKKTCARILFNEEEYATDPLYKTDYLQQADIIVEGHTAGYFQVFRFDVSPGEEELFLPEEQTLLDMMAERLGRIIERLQGEDALRESERHLRSTVDGLSAQIAVLDDQGQIILTNKAYRDFAVQNGIDPVAVSEGANYLGVCDTASGQHSEEAKPFAKGIREVLSGKRQSFELEYPCHSPDEKRWFIGRVTRFTGEGPRRVVVAHENITERKQNEEELRIARELSERIIEDGPVAITLVDHDGKIVFANLHAERLLGLDKSNVEALAYNAPEWLITDVDGSPFPDERLPFRQVMSTGQAVYNVQHAITWHDATRKLLGINGAPLHDEQGRIDRVVFAIQDITERKRTEEELQESLQRLEFALQGGELGAWDWNPQDGAVVYSDLWARMLEYRPDEVEHTVKFFKQHVHPEDLAAVLDRLTGHVEGRLPVFKSEHRMRTKSGRWLWVLDRGKIAERDEEGRPVRVTGLIADISERKKAEKSLRESEEKFRSIFASMTEIVVLHELVCDEDDRPVNYRIVDCNPSFTRITGIRREDAVGRLATDVYGSDSAPYLDEYARVALTGEPCTFITAHAPMDKHFDIRATSPGKNMFVTVTTDITERRQLEADMKIANVRLEALWSVTSLDDSNIKNVSDHVLKTITQMTNSLYGFYGFVDENETTMTIHSWSGDAMKNCAVVDKPTYFPVSEAGLWGEAIRKREPLIVNDYDAENSAKIGLPQGHVKLTNLLVVPYMKDNQITSVAAVANRNTGYDQKDVANITSFLTGIQAVIDSKRAEEELRKSYDLLHNLSRQVPGVIYQYRLYPDGSSAFPYASPGMYRIYEVTPEEVQQDATPVFGRLHPEDADRVSESIFESARTLETFYCEFRVVLPEQGLRWRWSQAHPQRTDDGGTLWHGIILDITERKQVELERERLNIAIKQSGEIIVITDAEGDIQYVNPVFERITGYTLHEVIGQNPRILKSGKQSDEFYRELWDSILSGKTWQGRFVNKRKDGSLYTEDATISPVFNADEEVVNYVAVKRDITEQLKMEVRYQQSQKMESVGRLAGGVAHDFNNMLSVITGNAELALGSIDTSHPVYGELTEIRNAAQRSADLTRQLLAFARKQTVAPKILNVNETIGSMLKMLQRLIGEGVDLRWIPAQLIEPIRIDPSQIDQLLANLLVNARDAIGHNVGKVTIETAPAEFDEDYCASHSGFVPGQYIMIAVSDDGCGMDEETMANAFEPFFTMKPQGEGAGLGLATVYGIVKQNQGFINVYSEPDQGTTFKIYLPVYKAQKIESVKNIDSESRLKSGHDTILLVEDEPTILAMCKKMLERLGYSVISASTPGEAIRLAEEHNGKIDLLMTDVVMPEMNGRDLAENLLSLYPNIKRLFMSGYTANVIAHQGVLDEGVNFIQKPFSMQGLSEKVREVLDQNKWNSIIG